MFTANGIMLIINSFIHLIMLTSLAFFIGNAIKNKDVVNGVTNVVGLGTSFLCGVFVPLSFLPDSVVKIAHIIPTYYYVESNEMITTLEEVNMTTLQPIIANMGILIGSTIIFIILSNVITNRRRKLG
jgi:ABC-2 type transport system permease protein